MRVLGFHGGDDAFTETISEIKANGFLFQLPANIKTNKIEVNGIGTGYLVPLDKPVRDEINNLHPNPFYNTSYKLLNGYHKIFDKEYFWVSSGLNSEDTEETNVSFISSVPFMCWIETNQGVIIKSKPLKRLIIKKLIFEPPKLIASFNQHKTSTPIEWASDNRDGWGNTVHFLEGVTLSSITGDVKESNYEPYSGYTDNSIYRKTLSNADYANADYIIFPMGFFSTISGDEDDSRRLADSGGTKLHGNIVPTIRIGKIENTNTDNQARRAGFIKITSQGYNLDTIKIDGYKSNTDAGRDGYYSPSNDLNYKRGDVLTTQENGLLVFSVDGNFMTGNASDRYTIITNVGGDTVWTEGIEIRKSKSTNELRHLTYKNLPFNVGDIYPSDIDNVLLEREVQIIKNWMLPYIDKPVNEKVLVEYAGDKKINFSNYVILDEIGIGPILEYSADADNLRFEISNIADILFMGIIPIKDDSTSSFISMNHNSTIFLGQYNGKFIALRNKKDTVNEYVYDPSTVMISSYNNNHGIIRMDAPTIGGIITEYVVFVMTKENAGRVAVDVVNEKPRASTIHRETIIDIDDTNTERFDIIKLHLTTQSDVYNQS